MLSYTRYTFPCSRCPLFPRRPAYTSTDHTRQLLATHRVHKANSSADQEGQKDAGPDEEPEWRRDVSLLAGRPAPVRNLPVGLHTGVFADVNNVRLACAAVAISPAALGALVEEFAFSVAAAVVCLFLAFFEVFEEGREYAENLRGVTRLLAGREAHVLGFARRFERGRGKYGLGPLAAGGRHFVQAVGVRGALAAG